LAETTIGLFKTEALSRGSPFLAGPLRTIDDVEYATMEGVAWLDMQVILGASAGL
jgi:putative transposase